MKKILSIFLVLCTIFTMFSAVSSSAEPTENDLSIVLQIGNPIMSVNGEEKPIDAEGTAPVIVNDRTLLPVRAVVEEIGGAVAWDGDTQTVTLNYNDDEIRLVINNTTAYLNNEPSTLDTAPTIINDRTMLPIRFIAESFKFEVDWNQAEEKVTITKSAETVPTTEPTTEPIIEPTTEPTAEPETNGSNSLVVYFSATGTTKSLAQTIAETTGAEIVEIIPAEPYTSADLNYNNDNCRANQEMNDESARPAISNTIENIDSYDTIYLGYPIWWGTMPRIINTFLDTYDLSDKTIMPFCTSGGSGIGTAVSAIRNAAPGADVKDGFRGSSSTSSAQIEEWLESNNIATN